jgi:hypothetical protein
MSGPILRLLWMHMSTARKSFYFNYYQRVRKNVAFVSFPQAADSRTASRVPRRSPFNTNALAAPCCMRPMRGCSCNARNLFRNQSFRFRPLRERTQRVACFTTSRERRLRRRTKRIQVIDFFMAPCLAPRDIFASAMLRGRSKRDRLRDQIFQGDSAQHLP